MSAPKLIIEADGVHHDADEDRLRDNYLRSHGYRVLRFNNFDIKRNLNFVLENIWTALHDMEFDPCGNPPSPPASPDPLPIGRGELRTELRQKRKTAALQNSHAADLILQNFHRIDLPANKIVAGYIAVNSEIDPAPILQFLAARKTPLCLPVVTGAEQPMQFREYNIGDELIQNNLFPFPEPAADKKIAAPDILLIPLLGFDRAGNRIGSGLGFYDRTLAALRAQKKIIAIGLAYAEQEVEKIQSEPHDQPLNFIVTPLETIYCPAP